MEDFYFYKINYGNKIEEIEKELRKIKYYKFILQGESIDTWYEHEEDMIEISKKFPNILFDLYIIGDGPCNLCHKYFKNGQMQKCPAIITFKACKL
jgi:hypothetical protein